MPEEARRPYLPWATGAVVTAALGRRLLRSPQVRFARMGGSSVATPAAAGWVTDFLNAAYYRRPLARRRVDDLRLAVAVLTTRWYRLGRRLGAGDVLAFHRAFGRDRFIDATRSSRGTMSRDQLLDGGARLHGPWFPDAYADPARRGWGVVFADAAERAGYEPERRLEHAALGELTPPVAPGREQIWHTYPPVPVASAERVVAALSAVETWPDYASEIGRFTPLRTGGLEGQTFEIEVVGHPTARTPVFLRGYVTVTRLVTADDPDTIGQYCSELNDAMARLGRDEPPPLPDGATPLVAFDLTTHEGHFMGHARNRLLLFEHDDQAHLRAAGTWDPMPWHLDQVYARTGRYAQHAFWGMESPEESMIHQIADAVAEPSP